MAKITGPGDEITPTILSMSFECTNDNITWNVMRHLDNSYSIGLLTSNHNVLLIFLRENQLSSLLGKIESLLENG